jgi:hypothetical protein
MDEKLNSAQIKVFYFFVFIYPLIELCFKFLTQNWAINHDMIRYQLSINIIEHTLAGMAVGIIVFPFLMNTLQKLIITEKFLLFVSVVTLTCLIYELIGFYLFYLPLGYMGMYQYVDTMRDLTLNIVGAILIFGIIRILE